ncbi:MAG: DUF4097 family beta strand repeat protein [Oscillospiraceae bacterium]|nr:DUF4097 family beta strand repeat protein [Oscillospiraceae bacterium]
MTTFQKAIKYLAIAFAVFLMVSIVGGILGAVGIIFHFTDGDAVADSVKNYEVSQNIKALDIQINAADMTVRLSDSFRVESNLKDLKVSEKDGTLTVREEKKFTGNYNGAVLTLYLPVEALLEQAHITSGAGRFTVEALSAGKVELDLGAGEVDIKALIATKEADIDGGAGKVTIADGALRNLDLDMGVGQLVLCSALTGDCELDLGVGESNLTILGQEQDYTLQIEKGLGSISVNGKQVSEYKGGTGPNEIDISGGVGAVKVVFQENK